MSSTSGPVDSKLNIEEDLELIKLCEEYQKKEEECDEQVLKLCQLRKNLPETIAKLLKDGKGKKLDLLFDGKLDYVPPERINVESKVTDIERAIERNVDLDNAKKQLEMDVERLEKEYQEKKKYRDYLVNAVLCDPSMPFLG